MPDSYCDGYVRDLMSIFYEVGAIPNIIERRKMLYSRIQLKVFDSHNSIKKRLAKQKQEIKTEVKELEIN
jgi:hypothetical protein